MERHEIETFLILAEELHFARTAERLRVSPGRVSQTIKKLERRINGPLFERTSRQVVLTPLGRRFRDELLPGYRQIQDAIRNATAAASSIAGTIRVAFSAPWNGKVLVRAADAFRAEHPHCEVRITEMSLADSYGPIKAGEIDLQVSEFPIDEPGLTTGRVLFSLAAALLVPADHPLARQDTASLEDLARAPLITFSGLSRGFHETHYPRHTPSGAVIEHLPVTTFHETLGLIGAGKGVTVVSGLLEQYHRRDDFALIPLPDAPPLEYGLAWPTARETPTVRAFAHAIHRAATEIAGDM
ncbi:LysR family transcriptional regulator [Nocardia wallacei]|uniref:LysR family transcriptional regulator n=1 Tax=Nocardia wallacei TaxID=480035 RepID=UPI00245548CA|nr:LysR family transcriptional regulator [Nocardia wallacei]